MKIKLIKRAVRFFFQRLLRGWDDSATWDLDVTIAKLILPRLKRYNELAPKIIDAPVKFAEVEEMIEGFELFLDEEVDTDDPKLETTQKVEKAVDLLAKNFRGLGW